MKKVKTYRSETALVRDLLEWLSWHPDVGYYWRNNQNTAMFDKSRNTWIKRRGVGYVDGTPDIIGVAPGGLFIGIEAKLESNKLSPQQIDFEMQIKRRNGCYIVARSIDDLKKEFQAIGEIRNLRTLVNTQRVHFTIDEDTRD